MRCRRTPLSRCVIIVTPHQLTLNDSSVIFTNSSLFSYHALFNYSLYLNLTRLSITTISSSSNLSHYSSEVKLIQN